MSRESRARAPGTQTMLCAPPLFVCFITVTLWGSRRAKKLADMVKEVKYVGPETVNGESCHVYTGTFETSMAGQQWTGTAKVWIGAGDGLVHQSDSEYKVATYGGKSHTVYEYNVNIKVEPPVM